MRPPPASAVAAERPAPSPAVPKAEIAAGHASARVASAKERVGYSTDAVRTPDTVRAADSGATPDAIRVGRRSVPLAVGIVGMTAALALGFVMGRWGMPVPAQAGAAPLRLAFESAPAGAEVIVDGKAVASTPARVDVPPTSERIEVRWPNPASPRSAGGAQGGPGAASTGSVAITTDPPGVQVVLGGQPRGTTPLVVTGLLPGVHEVEFAGPRGSVIERVTVRAGSQSRLASTLTRPPAPPGGWLVARAPVPLGMSEGGRRLGSGAGRVALAAGRHEVTFSADDLEFSTTRTVVVNAGATTTVDIELPQGRANFNAQPWAEVEVDGRRLGETPLGNVLLPLGRHTAIFRHPELGQRQVPFVVRARTAARVSASMNR